MLEKESARRNPLKDVDAPLRDQIDAKLFAALEELDAGKYVVDQWEKGNAHRSTWLERQREYLDQWDDFLVSSGDGPFQGSSDLHLPITFIVCKALHARYMQALWGQDPPFNARALKPAYIDKVPVVRDTIRHYLLKGANWHKGVRSVVDKWVWKWITAGSATKKWRWDVQYSRFRDVRTVKEPGAPIIQLVDGQEAAVPGPLVEREEEFDATIKCFDGPVLELVNHEDLLIIGGGGDPDLADEVIQRVYNTKSELWTLADRKIFRLDAVEAAIAGGRNYKAGATGNEIKDDRAVNAGQASQDNDAEHDRFEILEAYLKLDVDGSGIASDVIVWVHTLTKRMLRAAYLRRVSKTGKRPFKKADFHLRDGQEYGIGIPELMYPLQKEIDAIHNMRIDWGIISVMPFGFYRATSSLDPKTIRLEPGALIPVDNPQADVYFPNLGNRTVFGFQEEAALDNLIQRLTGINDLALGMMSSQGATRTATGSRVLANEMSANLDIHLGRLNHAWTDGLAYLRDMLQQRMPKGIAFQVTAEEGQDIWREPKREDLEGDFDIEVSANSASSNQGIQQEKAQAILQLAMNPLAIQIGVVGPQNVYEALKNVLQSMDVKDFAKFITKPQGYELQMTPQQEADLVLHGIQTPVTMNGDHAGFIQFWEMIKGDDQYLGQFNEEQTMLMEQQARKHAQMQQAVEQMAAQQANTSQMRMNAAQSQQQAPAAMNPNQGAMTGGAA